MKKSFILYHDQKDMFNVLTDEQSGKLIKEIFKYALTFKTPKIEDPVINMAFISIKGNLDRDNKKYEKICERNKNNGLKGGRPKNPENPVGSLVTQKTQANPENPSQPDNGNENDNDNGNDIKKKKYKKKKPTLYPDSFKSNISEKEWALQHGE